MPSARVDALFAHAAQRKILSIVALAYRTNAAVSSTRIARSSSSLPRYAARALQMRGRCSAGKRSDTHAAATSLGAMRPVEALYQMRARARTTFRSSPFQSDSAFHWAIVSKSALEGTVAKLAMRQPFVLFKGLTFQKLCLPGAFRPGDHHNKMLRPGLCVVHASPQYL